MNESSKLTVELPSDTEIVMRRSFDAPRHLVFDAFTKPEHVVHWWGPRGTTLTVCTLDARPGGKWRMVIRDANGDENGFNGEILEVTPPERFVWTFGWEGMPGEYVPEEITFEERGGKTTVTTRSTYSSKESRDAMLQSGMETGAAESYDRLEEHLAKLA
ncbi:MAG TPA: SRPBCC family protein [Dehalococcoidia bacterium]|nr:SRPBCC family protein [Dehalococcoidia bacterium]